MFTISLLNCFYWWFSSTTHWCSFWSIKTTNRWLPQLFRNVCLSSAEHLESNCINSGSAFSIVSDSHTYHFASEDIHKLILVFCLNILAAIFSCPFCISVPILRWEKRASALLTYYKNLSWLEKSVLRVTGQHHEAEQCSRGTDFSIRTEHAWWILFFLTYHSTSKLWF